jgi:3-oxoacyl-[acyl-carrier-protein] synthase-3
MKKAYIKAISYYLPEKVVTNNDLEAEFPEWSAEKVASKIGVSERHIAAPGETSGDMAVSAARNLFKEYSIEPRVIDFIMLCTQSPDYFLPTTACTIQERLGIPVKSGAIDFNLGCSGFVYGLALAKGLIISGVASNVLLLTSETYSKFIIPGINQIVGFLVMLLRQHLSQIAVLQKSLSLRLGLTGEVLKG